MEKNDEIEQEIDFVPDYSEDENISREIDFVPDYSEEETVQGEEDEIDINIYSDSSRKPKSFINDNEKEKDEEIKDDDFLRDDDLIIEEKSRKEKRDEKKFDRLKTKLENLRKKIEENPPKTIIGKKLAIARLNRLSNMVDKIHLKNSLVQFSRLNEKEEYKRYYNAQQSIMEDISNLEYEKESILRSIDRLYRFVPSEKKSMFAGQQKAVVKNMPKGYKLKSNKGVKDNTLARKQIEQLENRLEEIEREIEEKESTLEANDEIYKEQKEELKEDLKKDLSIVSPSIFTRIKNFFVSKIEKFKAWREERKAKVENNFSEALENSKTSSLRENIKVENLTPEAQAEFAGKIQKDLNNRQTAADRENVDKEK